MKSAHRSFSIGGRFGFARKLSLERHGRCLSIPYWHIDLMARDVFRLVWMARKEAVLLTYQMLEDCAAKDSETYTTALSSKEVQLENLQKVWNAYAECVLWGIHERNFSPTDPLCGTRSVFLNCRSKIRT